MNRVSGTFLGGVSGTAASKGRAERGPAVRRVEVPHQPRARVAGHRTRSAHAYPRHRRGLPHHRTYRPAHRRRPRTGRLPQPGARGTAHALHAPPRREAASSGGGSPARQSLVGVGHRPRPQGSPPGERVRARAAHSVTLTTGRRADGVVAAPPAQGAERKRPWLTPACPALVTALKDATCSHACQWPLIVHRRRVRGRKKASDARGRGDPQATASRVTGRRSGGRCQRGCPRRPR